MAREYGHRYWDGTVSTDESREAAYEQAARFKPGMVEVVIRERPDGPWERDVVQPHTLEERFQALFKARQESEELSLWRGTQLTDLGLSPNPWSSEMTSHLVRFEWGTRLRRPDGSLEDMSAVTDDAPTGEALARRRMALPDFPHHRALLRRPVVTGPWRVVEQKRDDE